MQRNADRLALIVGLLGAATAAAHDFWIEPDAFRPKVGSTVRLGLRVGENFEGEPVKRDAGKIERFVVRTAAGEAPIPGMDGSTTAGLLKVGQPGLLVVGYRSKHSRIELQPEQFEAYLKEEGLERIIELRKQRGDSGKPAREVYSRCAKALLAAGETAEGHDRALGFPLELVPQANPYALKPGEELAVRLVLKGQPLEGALVVAINRDAPKEPVAARTARDGQVKLRLPRPGVWLIKCVHMLPASADADADWESLWASLTFELSAADGARPPGD